MKLPFDPTRNPVLNDPPLKPIDHYKRINPNEIPDHYYQGWNDSNRCKLCHSDIQKINSCSSCRRFK